ncbi:uncharacterized protein [Eurosta solidaginis]|uniref:uncharacterized protein n=1 Tax=Eurosta solidaginis TaxID=178769 RepID=UPI0035308FA1
MKRCYLRRETHFLITILLFIIFCYIVLNFKAADDAQIDAKRRAAMNLLSDMHECNEILKVDIDFVNYLESILYDEETTVIEENDDCSNSCLLLLEGIVQDNDMSIDREKIRLEELDKVWVHYDKCFYTNPCQRAKRVIQCIIHKKFMRRKESKV